MAVKRLKPGVVRDAITEFLENVGEASVLDITKGVEAKLGQPVIASSVRSYLNLNVGVGKSFVREARGRYKLNRS